MNLFVYSLFDDAASNSDCVADMTELCHMSHILLFEQLVQLIEKNVCLFISMNGLHIKSLLYGKHVSVHVCHPSHTCSSGIS